MEAVYLEVLGGGCRSKPGPVCRDAASYDLLQAHGNCESSSHIIVQLYYSASLQIAYTDVSQLVFATLFFELHLQQDPRLVKKSRRGGDSVIETVHKMAGE
jgi:hypothetical protein